MDQMIKAGQVIVRLVENNQLQPYNQSYRLYHDEIQQETACQSMSVICWILLTLNMWP